MATKTLQEMVSYLTGVKSAAKKAAGIALIEIMQRALVESKKNIKRNFIGRGGRKLSGRLLNSVFTEYLPKTKTPEAVIGTRGIPYGAIHEFGMNPLTVKRRRWLWIKTPEAWKSGTYRRMTPAEFYQRQKSDSRFFYFKNLAMVKKSKFENMPLFYLRKKVTIPRRSYLQPAIEVAAKGYEAAYTRRLKELIG